MQSGIYAALSGAKLQELRLEVTANNLANASTAGYKADRVASRSFEFDLDAALDGPQRPEAIPAFDVVESYPGIYTKTTTIDTSFAPGTPSFTGNDLHVAVEGPGFIGIDTPQGPGYTRHGQFAINSDGRLVTVDGSPVRGKGLSNLGDGQISIDPEGEVSIDGRPVGFIELVEFANPDVLRKQGDSIFALIDTGVEPAKPENSRLMQGYIEQPNTSVVTEMVNLIELNRLYQTYQKAISSMDESTGTLIRQIAA